MKYHTPKGTIVELEDTAFDGGGEAKVYKVKSPLYPTLLCAKIYTDTDPSALHSKMLKIKHMIDHNPYQNAPVAVKESVAWPVEILLNQQNVFAGFLMPLIENSVSAVNILNRSLSQEFFQLDITDAKSYNNYLKITYCIAKAVAQLQSYGDYVIVDFKLDNIRLKRKGDIVLVDIDSIQITNKGKVLFHGPVGSDEYRAPEGLINNIITANTKINPSWDHHSLAVAFFYLFFQVHPFGAIHKSNPDLTNISALLKEGYYAMGKQKNELNLPIVLENFDLLGKQIRNLFHQCFVDGYKSPDKRPDAAAWRDTLLQEIQRTAGNEISLGRHHAPASPKKTPQTSIPVVAVTAATSTQQPNSPQGPINQPATSPAKPVNPPANPAPSPTPTPAPSPAPFSPSMVIQRFGITRLTNHAIVEWQVVNAASVKLNGKTVPFADSITVTLLPKLYALEATDLQGAVINKTLALMVPAVPVLYPVMTLAIPVPLSRPINTKKVKIIIKPANYLNGRETIVRNPIPLNVQIAFNKNPLKLSQTIPLNRNCIALNQNCTALISPEKINTYMQHASTKISAKSLTKLSQHAAVFLGTLLSLLKF